MDTPEKSFPRQDNILIPQSFPCPPSAPVSRQPLICFLSLWIRSHFLVFHVKWTPRVGFPIVWLLFTQHIVLRFLHAIVCTNSSLIPFCCSKLFHHMDIWPFIYPFTCRCLFSASSFCMFINSRFLDTQSCVKIMCSSWAPSYPDMAEAMMCSADSASCCSSREHGKDTSPFFCT